MSGSEISSLSKARVAKDAVELIMNVLFFLCGIVSVVVKAIYGEK